MADELLPETISFALKLIWNPLAFEVLTGNAAAPGATSIVIHEVIANPELVLEFDQADVAMTVAQPTFHADGITTLALYATNVPTNDNDGMSVLRDAKEPKNPNASIRRPARAAAIFSPS